MWAHCPQPGWAPVPASQAGRTPPAMPRCPLVSNLLAEGIYKQGWARSSTVFQISPAPSFQLAWPCCSLQVCPRSCWLNVPLWRYTCPDVFSCSPSSSLTDVFGAHLVLPTCPGHPCPSCSLLHQGFLPVPRGMGHRDMLLQTTACLTQEIGLFACRLQGDVEAPHGDPEVSVLHTPSLAAHRLQSTQASAFESRCAAGAVLPG